MRPGSLLALHGFLGHPDAFSGLHLERSIEALEAPLLLGHGPAPEVAVPTFEAEVERLATRAERLARPRRLFAYSQGARLGLALLARSPGLFQSAVLIGAQPGYRTSAERLARREVEDAWIAELEDRGVQAFVDHFTQSPLFGPPRPARDVQKERPYRWNHTKSGLVQALLILGTSQMPNLWPELARVSCPVELWVGALDEKFGRLAESMQMDLPTSRIERFAGSYHNPITDCPSAVQERLQAWLLD